MDIGERGRGKDWKKRKEVENAVGIKYMRNE